MGGHCEGQATDLRAHEWRLSVGYRFLYADEFFFGTHAVTPPKGLFGQPIYYHIHAVNFNLTYAVSDRISLRLGLPALQGTESFVFPDTVRHTNRSRGIGDITVVGNGWLFDPKTHARGNVAFGLGVKAPSGNYRYRDAFYFANGSSVPAPVDVAIELGDGGWGMILETYAFRRVLPRTFAYFTGSYLVSPRNQTSVLRRPDMPVPRSVPDVYEGRVGMTYNAFPIQGVALGLGASIDGIPYHDVIGGSDGFRRPGYVVMADPAISLGRAWGTLVLSTPIRVGPHLASQSQAQSSGGRIGAGDLARVLFFVTYSRRL